MNIDSILDKFEDGGRQKAAAEREAKERQKASVEQKAELLEACFTGIVKPIFNETTQKLTARGYRSRVSRSRNDAPPVNANKLLELHLHTTKTKSGDTDCTLSMTGNVEKLSVFTIAFVRGRSAINDCCDVPLASVTKDFVEKLVHRFIGEVFSENDEARKPYEHIW